ncbi:SIR2 family NAD-dependent protein deacylase [Ornithinimicrobium avium]|uniref:SIR2 family NAD-dependent protein deacylase n=1 Tax=Ornithinimicrobium avium TaxID=2283195 RepID=UPI002D218818|nr:Sir2 family NAD-dependent protein deacetylase [Ornithinimicrobium avium]
MSQPPAAPVPGRALELVRRAQRVCVLTGAGMSAESGVPTFRDAQVGLWERFDPAELATPSAWEEDPGQVWAWYAWRAGLVRRAEPNAGHRALADWQQRPGTQLRIATQNVDDLHERAGAQVLAHVHGSLFALRCAECGRPSGAAYPQVDEPVAHLEPPSCEVCGAAVRPGVVWFGEALPQEEFFAAAQAAEGRPRRGRRHLGAGPPGRDDPAPGRCARRARARDQPAGDRGERGGRRRVADHRRRGAAQDGRGPAGPLIRARVDRPPRRGRGDLVVPVRVEPAAGLP